MNQEMELINTLWRLIRPDQDKIETYLRKNPDLNAQEIGNLIVQQKECGRVKSANASIDLDYYSLRELKLIAGLE